MALVTGRRYNELQSAATDKSSFTKVKNVSVISSKLGLSSTWIVLIEHQLYTIRGILAVKDS